MIAPRTSTDEIDETLLPNHIFCKNCGEVARPAVLMFGDDSWIPTREQKSRYECWSSTARKLCRHGGRRLVILEIGAGTNVPSVRYNSQIMLRAISGNATLIRINVDYPRGEGNVISIMERGLPALKLIDETIKLITNQRSIDEQEVEFILKS